MNQAYFLRYFLASLKYRCSKAILNTNSDYPYFEIGEGVRKPIEILSHMSYVLRFAQSVFNVEVKLEIEMGDWNDEVNRFYKEIEILNALITINDLSEGDRIVEKLLQGPLSDAMTHVGQLSMIRRIARDPISGENFFNADIKVE